MLAARVQVSAGDSGGVGTLQGVKAFQAFWRLCNAVRVSGRAGEETAARCGGVLPVPGYVDLREGLPEMVWPVERATDGGGGKNTRLKQEQARVNEASNQAGLERSLEIDR